MGPQAAGVAFVILMPAKLSEIKGEGVKGL